MMVTFSRDLSDAPWPDVKRAPDEVRLLTYNIFLRPFIKNVDNDWKDVRLDAFCEGQLSNFDIICFQEVFDHFNSHRR